VDERLRLAEELVVLSQDRDDSRGKLDGLVMRGGTRLEVGDMAGFAADALELERVANRLQWWAPRWWAGNFRITEAALAGRFEDANALAEEQFKRSAEDANAFNAYAAQSFAIRRETGTVEEIEPLMASGVAADASLVAFRAALALSWVDLDRPDDATAALDALAADDFAVLPRDVSYTSCLVFLSETAAAVGAVDHARRLADLLAPHAGRLVVGGVGIVCFGAADRFLGMLAACVGEHERAAALYQSAAELETSVRGEPALARTWYSWGRLRDDRTMLERARVTAENLGMKRLQQRAIQAIDSGR
jgi:hypothetical protein